jgi:pimeloyl-ACP methyl ester carboxylesterase
VDKGTASENSSKNSSSTTTTTTPFPTSRGSGGRGSSTTSESYGSNSSSSSRSGCSSSVEECADQIAAALQQSGVVHCTLVGYSMGARVAMALSVRHPQLVGHLALLSGTPGIKVCVWRECVCV